VHIHTETERRNDTNLDFGARLDNEVLIESEVRFVLAINVSLDQPLTDRLVLRYTFTVMSHATFALYGINT